MNRCIFSRRAGVVRAPAKTLFLGRLLGSSVAGFFPRLDAAQTQLSTGDGDGQHWSDALNWTLGSLPESGDKLVFFGTGATMVNDIPNLSVSGISFEGFSFLTTEWSPDGNDLTINGDISAIGGEQFTISYTGGTGNDVVLTRLPTPPLPVLTIQRVPPSSVRLLWPTNAAGFTLQSNTNLNTKNWVFAPPAPAVVGTNNVVINTTEDGQKFYRLSAP